MQTQTTAVEMHPTIHSDALPPFILHQCAWCGAIDGGPLSGLIPTTREGTVTLVAGEYVSHGICLECKETVLADYYSR